MHLIFKYKLINYLIDNKLNFRQENYKNTELELAL
jgi:hypothetical protein